MSKPRSINQQSSLIVANTTSDGAGALASALPQQGVQTGSGTSGWAFFTDGTDGIVVCTTEPIPGLAATIIASAQGGAIGYNVVVAVISATSFSVTVRDSATQAVIDLAATVVAIQAIAALTA